MNWTCAKCLTFLLSYAYKNVPVFCPSYVSEVWLRHNYPSQSALWTQTGLTQPLCLIRIKNIQLSPVLFSLFFILSPSKQLTWLHIYNVHAYFITPKIAKRKKRVDQLFTSFCITWITILGLENHLKTYAIYLQYRWHNVKMEFHSVTTFTIVYCLHTVTSYS